MSNLKYLLHQVKCLLTQNLRLQTGILRLACADSLERSHLAGFFLALPILAELARSVSLLPPTNSQGTTLSRIISDTYFVLRTI